MVQFNAIRGSVCINYCGLALLASACSGETRHGSPDNTALSREAITSEVVAVASPQREITIASLPNAICSLTSLQYSKTMPVYADDSGIVHLWAAAQASVSDVYLIDCDESGNQVQYEIDLADAATFLPATPRVAPPPRTVRPALTDPMSLSQAELIAANYPPRPDPVLAAPLYKTWLELVSTPVTLIQPRLVERPDLNFDPVLTDTSLAWTGLVLEQPGIRYDWAPASFTIPAFSPVGSESQAGFWTGIDGWNPDSHTTIIQDGVNYGSVGSLITYGAWRQFFPRATQTMTNYTVSPGDAVQFWAWEGDASCNGGAGLGSGCFWSQNQTPNPPVATVVFRTVLPPTCCPTCSPAKDHCCIGGCIIRGKQVEAIMERQFNQTGMYFPLSPWSGPLLATFSGFDSNGKWHNATSDRYWNVTMTNSAGQTLADSGKVSDSVEQVIFVHSQ